MLEVASPDGECVVVATRQSVTKEQMRADVYQVSRGNQDVMEKVLMMIREADQADIRRMQVMASREIHGKNTLWEIWDSISHSQLVEGDKQKLMDFFDGPFFRHEMSQQVMSWLKVKI